VIALYFFVASSFCEGTELDVSATARPPF
jgi:hypothetical protein